MLPSADLDRAVTVGVEARMQNAGQSCIAGKRFILHEEIADRFLEAYVAKVEALTVGDPFDPATEVGPLVTAAGRDNVEAQVEDARSHGATILCGGGRAVGPDGAELPGFFYRPTVITDITPAMRVATEEVFGPVALVYRVADADQALAVANDTEFGLGSSVWTDDPDEQQRFVNGSRPGRCSSTGWWRRCPPCPSGASRRPAIGRELSSQGIHEFCNIKSVWVA